MAAERIPQLRVPLPGRMFPPRGPRRGCPRQPGPWWDGPWLCPPAGPEDTWGEPPWGEPPRGEPPWGEPPWHEPRQERQHGKRRRRRHQPRAPRPFPGPAELPWKEEEEGWAPQECPPHPPWDDTEDFQGAENGFGGSWHPPSPRAPGPFPGPADVPWKEEEQDGRWDCPPQPPWDDREDFQGFEDGSGDGWYQELLPGPWCEFPEEEQPPPWPPSGFPWNPGFFRGPRPPWRRSPRRSQLRQLTPVPLLWCPRPPRAPKPHSKPCPAPSKRSQERPQPPAAPPGAAESPEQPQDVPAGSGSALEPPGRAGSPVQSPAAPAAAVELLVELEAGQTPVGSQEQDPCALGTDPAPLEETSSYPEIQEQPEVELCSPGVPKAGTGSHPQSPAAPPEPARRELQEPSSSGEAGAELSPHPWEQPPRGAGEAKAEAAQDGPLQSLQPPKNPQVPPGCAAEPQAQPSQAPAGACTSPEPSQPGSGETNPAVSGQPQLCSLLPAPFPAGIDLRSAAVLAKKAEIELSYQQFSLTIAVVATMLLQKEPSLEAALGLALRANLRQRRIHHLRQLRDFIDTIDSATASL